MGQAYWNVLLTRCLSTNRTFIWSFLNVEIYKLKANSHLARKFSNSEIFPENLRGSMIEAFRYLGSESCTGDHAEISVWFNFSYITAIWQYRARSSSWRLIGLNNRDNKRSMHSKGVRVWELGLWKSKVLSTFADPSIRLVWSRAIEGLYTEREQAIRVAFGRCQ